MRGRKRNKDYEDEPFKGSDEDMGEDPDGSGAGEKRKGYSFSFGFIVTMTVLIVAAAVASVLLIPGIIGGGEQSSVTEPAAVTEKTDETPEETESESETQPPETERTVTVDSPLAGAGELVLVNRDYEYSFPATETASLYSVKNGSYKISSSSITLTTVAADALGRMAADFEVVSGKHDLMVTSGMRSYDEQLDIYSQRVESYGLESAQKYVAVPGFSEHHTGLAFDLSIYTDDGAAMHLPDDPAYSWITENCYKYGFVRRYDEAKYELTGISGEDWHFRYVGYPHAYYMAVGGLCLEEYIALIMKHGAQNPLTFNDETGVKYDIFYVPASESGQTVITVPPQSEAEYAVSGTNCGGFAVTVRYF